jgi:nicotinamide phosphoribosyltransferase
MDTNNLLISNILDTDSYKFSQDVQYPPNTTAMYSYFESRGGRFDKTLFFGLQYYLLKYFSKPITIDQVEEAKEFAKLHGVPFNYSGWLAIATELNGKLPIRIKAVPEGSIIPIKNVLLTVESTDARFFWVVSWFETMLVRLWYPITIATNSWTIKQNIKKYLDISSEGVGEIAFKLHDFGSRGATCQEQAMIGGAAHLVNFMGSDTIAGVWMANKYYNENMAGFSIPASEHSTMTMWGKGNEVEAYRNMIKQFGNGPIFACVSDSYDIYNACENLWGDQLKNEVNNMNATLVQRPDSGDPDEVVNQLLHIAAQKFGYTINGKGFKVLNKIRIIQGDGINGEDVDKILKRTVKDGFSATNVNFGMGGGLLQKDFNRDTNKFAFKCSWAKVNGEDINVFKDPVTDNVKKSKKGRLALMVWPKTNVVRTLPEDCVPKENNLLRTVFENGEITYNGRTSFAEIRERSEKCVYNQYNGWIDRDVY